MRHFYIFFLNGQAITVNSERYLRMLVTFLISKLKRKLLALKNFWLQQDGVTATHTGNNVMDYLRSRHVRSRDYVVLRNGGIASPSRSLTSLFVTFFFGVNK